jgi:hypothetical protein
VPQPLVKAPVEQHQKSESGRLECLSLSGPTIRVFSRRIIEPKSCVGKSLAQNFKVLVAWVLVAIEAKIALLGQRVRSANQNT